MFINGLIVGAVGFDYDSSENDSEENQRQQWVNADAGYRFEIVDEFHGLGWLLVLVDVLAISMSAPSFCM